MMERPCDPIPSDRAPSLIAALNAAVSLCWERGVQMTVLRRAILEMLWQVGRPLSAYDLLDRLEGVLDRKLAPPTVYRTLEFLLRHGLIARIESRGAYVPCAHPERPHGCIFFVCDRCNGSVEIEDPALERLIERDADRLGFRIARRVVELQGTCAHCASPDGVPLPES